MKEQITEVLVSALPSSVSVATLALLGVETTALWGGVFGTLVAVTLATETQTRRRLAVESCLSSYSGALIGTVAAAVGKGIVPALGLGGAALLILVSALGAYKFKDVFKAAGDRLVQTIKNRPLPGDEPKGE